MERYENTVRGPRQLARAERDNPKRKLWSSCVTNCRLQQPSGHQKSAGKCQTTFTSERVSERSPRNLNKSYI